MYKLYYEKDTILSSGRVLRGDMYIQDTTTGAIVNVYNPATGRKFYCTPYKKVALKEVGDDDEKVYRRTFYKLVAKDFKTHPEAQAWKNYHCPKGKVTKQ